MNISIPKIDMSIKPYFYVNVCKFNFKFILTTFIDHANIGLQTANGSKIYVLHISYVNTLPIVLPVHNAQYPVLLKNRALQKVLIYRTPIWFLNKTQYIFLPYSFLYKCFRDQFGFLYVWLKTKRLVFFTTILESLAAFNKQINTRILKNQKNQWLLQVMLVTLPIIGCQT